MGLPIVWVRPAIAQTGGVPSRPVLTNFARLPDHAFQFHLAGEPDRTFSVQISMNLAEWVTLFFTNAPTGLVDFIDSQPAFERRFYRGKAFFPNPVAYTNYHGWSNSIVLNNGIVEALIVPTIGRIMQFRFIGEEGPFWENRSLDGQNPDPESGTWKNFGGDKTWPAPQSDWPNFAGRGWPPPKAFDSMSVTAGVATGVVTLTSPVDPGYGIRTRRRIELHPEEPVMRVTTTYEKISGATNRVSVWVITQLNDPSRVFIPAAQSSLFPQGYILQSDSPPSGLIVTNGLISLTRDRVTGHKIGSDAGTLLWVGQSVSLRIDSPRVEGEDYADNGSSAEVYTNPNPEAYVELELLGPLQILKAGEQIERTSSFTLVHRTEATAEAEARKILGR